jgi:hypothetical protein
MLELIIAASISFVLLVVSTLLYYEILRVTWKWIPELRIAPRKRILAIMTAIFFGHTVMVWMYGAVYWLIGDYTDLGKLVGENDGSFLSFLYFSAATYSSLGLGDVYPTGVLRMITGVEVLNGLVLIGWSVSFTYLAMQKFWDLH